MRTYEAAFQGYEFSTDKHRLDFDTVFHFLSHSYWGGNLTEDALRISIEGSICAGVYHAGQQVGFARVITDGARFAYLADVFILAEHRGKGLSKFLMQFLLQIEGLQNAKWMLATADAHGLYSQYGFTPLPEPEKYMVRMPEACR